MRQQSSTTVGQFLIQRLEQLGLKHIFGVPGDYVLGFYDLLMASNIKLIGTCNELNAGYAADGYARITGFGAVCVTYGVGGLSLVNAVAGAMAERIPMAVISGGPATSRRSPELMLHHTFGDKDLVRQVFEPITVTSLVLTDAKKAASQIDAALTACLEKQGPVYIELPVDMVSQPCSASGRLSPKLNQVNDPSSLEQAVESVSRRMAESRRTVVWVGHEISRYGAEEALVEFLDHTGLPVAASRQAKGMLDESNPAYLGVYKGVRSLPQPRQVFDEAELVLNFGVWPTSINTGGFTARLSAENTVQALDGRVQVNGQVFEPVSLPDFIRALTASLPKGPLLKSGRRPMPIDRPAKVNPEAELCADRLFEIVSGYLTPQHILMADTGGPMISSEDMALPDGCRTLRQAYYLSIGYTVPAAIGVGLAAPEKRPVVIVGDGSFQMTVQAISTLIRLKLNPIVIVWNNDGYQIERIMHDGAFNDLQGWRYSQAPHFFGGGWGAKVRTESELEAALSRAQAELHSLALIEAVTGRWDLTQSMKIAHQGFQAKKV
jgi:TPP-dependent 2-oxoacid decarboxylase